MTQHPLRAKPNQVAMDRTRWAFGSHSRQRGLVLLLALLATMAVTVVRGDASWAPWTIWTPTILSTVIAVALMMVAPARAASKKPDGIWVVLTIALITYVLPWNFAVRSLLSQSGEPVEFIMLTMVQQASIVAVTLYPFRKAEWISGLLSFFLFVFCITISSDRSVYILAAVYGLLSIWWLMGAYWEKIQGGFVAQQSVPVVRLRASILIGLIAILLSLGYVGATRTTTISSLLGFMPTSGGSGESDDSARSGIGDGDRVVAAQENALSFGPVESELFLEDTSPSLYDMFSDIYGDDPKVNKRTEKAISLGGAEGPQKHQHLSQSQKSSREFSAVRRSKTGQDKKPDSKLTSAMLYLIGEVPTHLAMETFDAFDGRQWTHQQPQRSVDLKLMSIDDKPYVSFAPIGSVPFALREQAYGVKLINLKSPRIPSPHLLSAVHVDKVDRVDFYGKTRDDIPEMTGRDHIPQLTVLHLRSFKPHLHELRDSTNFLRFATHVRSDGVFLSPDDVRRSQYRFDEDSSQDNAAVSPSAFDVHYQVAAERSAIEKLASEWTRGVSRGWCEVDAVVSQLKETFQHDPSATAPDDCEDVIEFFLRNRRGPDYLFATTAAMLLRSRGFPTRLATGFYADPNDFEYATGQTILRQEDLHTWLQVSIDGRNWISVEATPGYLNPLEDLNWSEWAQLNLWMGARWAWNHPWTLLTTFVLLSWAIWARVWLAECALILWVASIGNLISQRSRTLWLIWLLQWRGKLRGKPRPPHKTLRNWLNDIACNSPALRDFIPYVERALYAPHHSTSINHDPDPELQHLCRLLLWGRRLFQNQPKQSSH